MYVVGMPQCGNKNNFGSTGNVLTLARARRNTLLQLNWRVMLRAYTRVGVYCEALSLCLIPMQRVLRHSIRRLGPPEDVTITLSMAALIWRASNMTPWIAPCAVEQRLGLMQAVALHAALLSTTPACTGPYVVAYGTLASACHIHVAALRAYIQRQQCSVVVHVAAVASKVATPLS